ncbi:hypothetical protein E2C01_011494 [Portunus trituberculatus]|uniref:Uncharacterized protein n=1 Tax=Portunus trituberculatus TaxID=210409 RepID=A0A5B7DBX0_PORTR|nr:hypothetical protein [Portunus trituberculatus]
MCITKEKLDKRRHGDRALSPARTLYETTRWAPTTPTSQPLPAECHVRRPLLDSCRTTQHYLLAL